MKINYYTSLIILFLGACNSTVEKKAKPELDPKVLISCEGIGKVKLTYSYEDLQKKFGATSLTDHENTLKGKYVSLWENTPEQLNIYWNEKDQPFKTIKYIETVDPMAPYMTKDSIGVGMSLRDLVRKNNSMAITFKNFSSASQPGKIIDFTTGEIPKNNPCFEGTLERTGQQPVDVVEMTEFDKQEEIKSFDRVLQRMDVVLSSVRVTKK